MATWVVSFRYRGAWGRAEAVTVADPRRYVADVLDADNANGREGADAAILAQEQGPVRTPVAAWVVRDGRAVPTTIRAALRDGMPRGIARAS